MLRRLAFALSLLSLPAIAGEVSCPSLATALQAGTCANEAELKWGFTGYCGDNARLYDKEDQACLSLENYKALKDVSLWEAGEFQGYLHCSLPAQAIRDAKAKAVGVLRVGSMTRVVCSYDNGIDLTYRTKATCRVEGDRAVCGD